MSLRARAAKSVPLTLATAKFADDEGDDDADSDFHVSDSSEAGECVEEQPVKQTKIRDELFDVEKAFGELKADEEELARFRPPPRNCDPEFLKLLRSLKHPARVRRVEGLVEEPLIGRKRARKPQLEVGAFESTAKDESSKRRKRRSPADAARASSAEVVAARMRVFKDDEALLEGLCATSATSPKAKLVTGARAFFAKLTSTVGIDKSAVAQTRALKRQVRAAATPYIEEYLAWEKPGEVAKRANRNSKVLGAKELHQRLLHAVSQVKISCARESAKKVSTSEVTTEEERQRAAHLRMRTASSHCGTAGLPSLPRCVQRQTTLLRSDEISNCLETYEIIKDSTSHGNSKSKESASSHKKVIGSNQHLGQAQDDSPEEETQTIIGTGTKLVCLGDTYQSGSESSIPIYSSPQSHRIIGRVRFGERVTASGPPLVEDGFTMLPIIPAGAVQVDYFTIYEDGLQQDEKVEEVDEHALGHAEVAAEVIEDVDPAWAPWEKHFEGELLYKQMRAWLHLQDDEDWISPDTAISQSEDAWKKAKLDQGITNELRLRPDYGALERREFINQAVAHEAAAFLRDKKTASVAIARGTSKKQEAGARLL